MIYFQSQKFGTTELFIPISAIIHQSPWLLCCDNIKNWSIKEFLIKKCVTVRHFDELHWTELRVSSKRQARAYHSLGEN